MNKNSDILLFEQITRMKMLSGEMITEEELNEIDWENDFSDVSKKCILPSALAEYLNNVIVNSEKKPSKRDKLTPDKPYIHSKSIPKTSSGEIDVEMFIKNITAMPKEIISGNTKMKKSSNEERLSVNIGIPALRGLVYDIQENQFYFVNTCPGAGTCALICYARKGSYVMFPGVFVKQTRVLNLLLNYPDRFEKLLKRELEMLAIKNPDRLIEFRWNDAGDFFTKKYFEIALRITKELKAEGYNVNSYAYTKMGDVINLNDPDMVVNFSMDANKKETGRVKDFDKIKKAETISKDLFDDLYIKNASKKDYEVDEKGKPIFRDKNNVNILKQRLADKYNVDINTILTYEELLNTPEGRPLQYNVIVAPKGEGDIGAQRADVQYSFLLFH
jgi:hypothetical protein